MAGLPNSYLWPLFSFLQWHVCAHTFRGHKYAENHFFLKKQNSPLSCNCSNPCIYYTQKSHMECVLIKDFKQSLSCSVSESLRCWGVKLDVRTYQLWQLPGQSGWQWTRSVSGCITSFLLFICMQDWHISQLSRCVVTHKIPLSLI